MQINRYNEATGCWSKKYLSMQCIYFLNKLSLPKHFYITYCRLDEIKESKNRLHSLQSVNNGCLIKKPNKKILILLIKYITIVLMFLRLLWNLLKQSTLQTSALTNHNLMNSGGE